MFQNKQNDDQPKRQNIVLNHLKKRAKKGAGKVTKKMAKQLAKKTGKVILMALKSLLKWLLVLISPYLGIILGILFIFFVIYFAATMIFSFAGDGDLTGDSEEFRQYVIEKSKESIDYSKPEQREYMFPYELVFAIMQLYESEDRKVSSKKAAADIIKKMKPEFEYDDFEGYTETEVTTCGRDGCTTSGPTKTPQKVTLLVGVEAWNGVMTATVEEDLSDWASTTTYGVGYYENEEGETVEYQTSTTTRTRVKSFSTVEDFKEDYTKFERDLMSSPFNYKENDIVLTETLYQSVGGIINYSEMKLGYSNGDYGYGGPNDGMNVIPGAGVPAEYMQWYLGAEKKYGVDWFLLAAVHWVETKYSTYEPMISSVGAEGHMRATRS